MPQVIQKWGNSLAIRIPKNIANDSHIEKGSEVNLFIEDDRIIIEPIKGKRFSLATLLSGITNENKHSETETGKAVGEEYW